MSLTQYPTVKYIEENVVQRDVTSQGVIQKKCERIVFWKQKLKFQRPVERTFIGWGKLLKVTKENGFFLLNTQTPDHVWCYFSHPVIYPVTQRYRQIATQVILHFHRCVHWHSLGKRSAWVLVHFQVDQTWFICLF